MSKALDGRILGNACLCRCIRPILGLFRALTLYGLVGGTMTLALVSLFFPDSYRFFRVVAALLPLAMVAVHVILGLCGSVLSYPYWRGVASQSHERRRVSALFLLASAFCVCPAACVCSPCRAILAFALLACVEQLLSRRVSLGMERLVHSSFAHCESPCEPHASLAAPESVPQENAAQIEDSQAVEEASEVETEVESASSVESVSDQPTFRNHPKGDVYESYDTILNEPIGELYNSILYQQARMTCTDGESSQLLATYYVPAVEAAQTAVVNIPFEPVFDNAPRAVDFEQTFGPEASIKCTMCEAFGARLEVKCPPDDYDPMDIIRIDFAAVGPRSGNNFD